MRKFLLLLFWGLSSIGSAATYYVSTSGIDSNPGTISQPFGSLQKAINIARPGDIVYIRGGIYYPTVSIDWNPEEGKGVDGTPTAPIKYENYPGEKPVFDFIGCMPVGNYNSGFYLNSIDYIQIKGVTVRNVKQTRDYVECLGLYAYACSNLRCENVTVHDIDGNAFRFFGNWRYPGYPPYENPDHANFPADSTFFINCDAYNCCDSLPRTSQGNPFLGGAADGWKTHNEPGSYIFFEGCRVWNCSDDGFDPSGDVYVEFRNCWSFENGLLDGDGNGYKTGAVYNSTPVSRVLTNCIAANNRAVGFMLLEYPDYHRTNARYYNNLSFGNQFGFSISNNATYPNPLVVYKNNIAYETGIPVSQAYMHYEESNNSWNWVDGYPGYEEAFNLTDSHFQSLDVNQLKASRKSDGSLPDVTFGHLTTGSPLINAGINVGLPYNGTAPDIGAFEYGQSVPGLIYVTSISVTGAGGQSTITTDNGTLQLSATVLPANASNKAITWSISSGLDKASISSSGLVTALRNGTAVARASATDGSGVYGILTITITNQVIPVSGITITGTVGVSSIATDNGTLQLIANVLPSDATNRTVTWSVTSGADKATLSSTGLVTATDNGTMVARATANDGSGVFGSITISILNQVIQVTGITVTGAGGSSTITSDNGTLQLSASVLPANATNKTVTWSVSSGADKASVNASGLVTALDNGTAVIRANANDGSGIYGNLTITITNQIIPVTVITVYGAGGATLITSLGGTLQLSATVLPANASNKTVTWAISSGSDKASINSSGLVTAISNGTTVVRATANDGSGVFGTLTITISDQIISVSSITVSGTGGGTTINTDNGTLQLSAAILPANATNKTVSWSVVSGSEFVSVNTAGLVTASINGTAIIRATANDGSGINGFITLTVSNQIIQVTSIVITSAAGATAINTENGTMQLNAQVLPVNASNKSIAWSVSTGSDKASVSQTGLVTALNNGIATIRAMSNDGSGVYSTFSVTVAFERNSAPVILLNYLPSSYSGFVNEIDASGTYDVDSDNLAFSWSVPENISVSNTTGIKIKYLGPVVSTVQKLEFKLSVNDGKTSETKVIPIDILPYRPELEVAEIVNVEAGNYQVPNYPYNILDGNIGTMWAAEGEEQWLIVELKHTFNVQHVKMAFQPGGRAESVFDIFGSNDKDSWDLILSKTASCSFSGDIQVFEFPASKTGKEYKYVKVLGYGNAQDNWNYISELKIFGYRFKGSIAYEQQPVKLYPNPARETVTVRIDEPSFNADFIQITNLTGKVSLREKLDPGIREITLPLDIKKGLYLVQLYSGSMILNVQKLVVN